MADVPELLKSLTVKSLRDLARKHLGAGYSRLKTKSQLVRALAKEVPASVVKGLLGKVSGKAPAPKVPAKTAAPAPAKTATRTAAPTAKAKATPPHTPAPAATAKPSPVPPPPVADLERLGELPDRYYDASFVALAVDPQTLFLYWDHADPTIRAAASGLPHPRAVLSLHSEGRRVQEIDFALESRAYYLRGLAPGRSYHAEIDFVGSDGRRQRLGRPSNPAALPPAGPSDVIDDRFVAFPWELRRDWHLEARPAPGMARRELAEGAMRGGASMPLSHLRPWLEGGVLSGRAPTSPGRR